MIRKLIIYFSIIVYVLAIVDGVYRTFNFPYTIQEINASIVDTWNVVAFFTLSSLIVMSVLFAIVLSCLIKKEKRPLKIGLLSGTLFVLAVSSQLYAHIAFTKFAGIQVGGFYGL